MKMYKPTIFLILLVIMAPSSKAADEDWTYYAMGPGIGKKKSAKHYYDRNSITEIEHNVFEVYHLNEAIENGILNSMEQYWIDCNKNLVATGTVQTYMLGKLESETNLFKSGWYSIEDVEPTNKLMQLICNR